jgi:nucleolar protein 9
MDARDPEAPFEGVEADVKAYFRTVDLQIRDWQENQDETAEEDDVQPNESAYVDSRNSGF